MEDSKFKRIIICILVAVGIIFGFLALLNGRYTTFGHNNMFIWDNWKAKPIFFGEEDSAARLTFDSLYKKR